MAFNPGFSGGSLGPSSGGGDPQNSVNQQAGSVSGGIIGSIIGAGATLGAAEIQASAAEDAANAQKEISNTQIAFETRQLEAQYIARLQATKMAQPSASELASIGQNLELQNLNLSAQLRGLDRDNQILESIDPSIKEAGKQSLELMHGQAAAILKPLQDQQTRQRSQLEQTLASRLGPDYATSSAGVQALQAFDQNAQMQTAQAQQSSLSQLLGVVQGANMNPVNNAATAFGSLTQGNVAGFNMQNIVNQAPVNAFLNSQVGQQVNFDNAFTAAGNTNVGGMILGQAVGNIGNAISGVAGQSLGASFGAHTVSNASSTSGTASDIVPTSAQKAANPNGVYFT